MVKKNIHETKLGGMTLRKMLYRLSLFVSFFYGFYILIIFDAVNRKPYFNPVFRYPTQKGILIGGISVILYTMIMVILGMISKKDIGKFILINIFTFFIGLVFFSCIGVIFFIDSDTGP